MRRGRPLVARLLALLLGLTAGLGVAELVVRVAGVAPEVSPIRRGRLQLSDDPRLIFEPVPGMVVAGAADLWDEYPGAANRLGYRDREHRLEKPPGTFRIVVLGDSVAAGWGVERREDTLPARLERDLAERGRPTEVLNFAVTGYNTDQEVETLASRALPYAPDLVLVTYCLNDRRPPDPRIVAALEKAAARPGAVAPSRLASDLRRALFASALYRTVRFRWLDDGDAAEALAAGTAGAERRPPRPDEVGDRWADGRPVAGPAAVEAAFDRLAHLTREAAAAGRPFRVAVVVFPYLRDLFQERYPEHREHVAKLAERHGFAHLDLTDAFERCARDGGRLAFDRYHPNARGHRCAAAAVSRFLISADLVPAPR